jgi:hypothetical protein
MLNPGTYGGNETPVDLFFLFDASASQDGNIQEIVKQCKSIIAKYAGDEANKDVCHVGSALFLGPNVKMMCSCQCVQVD